MSQTITAGDPPVSVKTWIAVAGAMIGAFMAVLNIQITSASMRDIEGGIGTGGINGAWITTPYLVPDEAVFSALRLAVMRGVDVRILIPSRRDHRVVFEASKLYAYDSVRAGVRIFRYRPGFLHQKVVLIDNVAAAVGSANLDNRSFRLNFEIMVLTVDRNFAAEVEAMLLRDFAEAFEIDRNEYRQASALRRVVMHVARLFAPIL